MSDTKRARVAGGPVEWAQLGAPGWPCVACGGPSTDIMTHTGRCTACHAWQPFMVTCAHPTCSARVPSMWFPGCAASQLRTDDALGYAFCSAEHAEEPVELHAMYDETGPRYIMMPIRCRMSDSVAQVKAAAALTDAHSVMGERDDISVARLLSKHGNQREHLRVVSARKALRDSKGGGNIEGVRAWLLERQLPGGWAGEPTNYANRMSRDRTMHNTHYAIGVTLSPAARDALRADVDARSVSPMLPNGHYMLAIYCGPDKDAQREMNARIDPEEPQEAFLAIVREAYAVHRLPPMAAPAIFEDSGVFDGLPF